MLINIGLMLYAVHIFTRECCGLDFLELPGFQSDEEVHNIPPPLPKAKVRKEKVHFDGEVDKAFVANNVLIKKPPSSAGKKDIYYGPYEIDNTFVANDEINKKTLLRNGKESIYKPYPYPKIQQRPNEDKDENERRYWLVSNTPTATELTTIDRSDKDANLKGKISTLVQQTMHDTDRQIKSLQSIKDKNRDKNAYKIGFILVMVKRSKDTLNELFNMAVKHRNEWRALEQLKTFEMIVHTNVDTTNLVRQLVEIHIQEVNLTKSSGATEKRRVVLL